MCITGCNIIDQKVSEIKDDDIAFRLRDNPLTDLVTRDCPGIIGRSEDTFTRQGTPTSYREKCISITLCS